MFVSLSASFASHACAVRQSIDNYYKQQTNTNFFDWLVCSMKSINDIIEGKPILFDEENYTYPNTLNTVSIDFKNFDLLISHHDIHEFNETSISDITGKYTRRRERFLNMIKTDNQEIVHFVRYCKYQDNLEEEEINKFFELLKNLNSNFTFKFVLISDDNTLIIPKSLESRENFIHLNLSNYIDDEVQNEPNEYFKIIKMYKCVYTLIK